MPRWDELAMYISLGIVFGLEMAGVFGKNYITITALVRAYIPIWLRAMFAGWIVYHFLIDPVNFQ